MLAAMGSAIGLGSIWRFPYVVYDNGGGAYLVPYLSALLTAGVPLMILEYGLGQQMQGVQPLEFEVGPGVRDKETESLKPPLHEILEARPLSFVRDSTRESHS